MAAPAKKLEDGITSTVAGLERELAAAMADCNGDACARFLTDDFSEIAGAAGKPLSVRLRAEWLTALTAGRKKRFTVDDIAVSVHGVVAVATTVWIEEQKEHSTPWFVTDIWKTVSGGWQLGERHVSRLSPAT